MFVLERKEARAALRDQAEANAIVRGLHEAGYQPAVRSVLDSVYAAAGIQRGSDELDALASAQWATRARPEAVIRGDLFFSNDHVFVFHPVQSRVRVWSIRHHGTSSKVDLFCDAVASAARKRLDGRRLRGMEFTWNALEPRIEPRYGALRRMRDTRLKSVTPSYTPEEATGALLLGDGSHRETLLRLARSRGRGRAADVVADAGETVAEALLRHGLVRREYIVLCRQDSHTICSVRDKAQLDVGGMELRCSICGRPFTEENVQDIFALSDAGGALIDGSRWMTIWVTEQLRNSGIDLSMIAWNATAGEDEVDLVVEIHGVRVFFELKDRAFGLGDAYPFVYRVERYGADRGIVITTDRVAEEAKKFLSDQAAGPRSTSIITIEGLAEAERRLPQVVDELSRAAPLFVISQFCENLGLNFLPVADRWMNQVARNVTRTVIPLAVSRTA